MSRLKFSVVVLVACVLTSMLLASCSSQSNYSISSGNDLTKGIGTSNADVVYDFTSELTSVPTAYEKYSETVIEFSSDILTQAYNKDENTVIAPLSMYKSLSLLYNGADGATSKEFKDILGDEVISQTNVNDCTDYITQRLNHFNTEENYVNLANSMWIKNDIEVRNGFLQKNANFYEDAVYQVDFSSNSIIDDINNWANFETKDEVKTITETIDEKSSIYLANTLSLNAEFLNPYNVEEINSDVFYNANGEEIETDYLVSTERVVKTNEAVAISKGLKDVPATFVAILPNENVSIEDYIEKYLDEQLVEFLEIGEEPEFMNVSIPSFTISADNNYKQILQGIGFESIFTDSADFNNLSSSDTYLSDITQKVDITFNANGVQTTAENIEKTTNTQKNSENDNIIYNRPFIFLVVDNESHMPVILGSVNNQ